MRSRAESSLSPFAAALCPPAHRPGNHGGILPPKARTHFTRGSRHGGKGGLLSPKGSRLFQNHPFSDKESTRFSEKAIAFPKMPIAFLKKQPASMKCRFTFPKRRPASEESRAPFPRRRVTFAESRVTFQKSRFTFAESRFTFRTGTCASEVITYWQMVSYKGKA